MTTRLHDVVILGACAIMASGCGAERASSDCVQGSERCTCRSDHTCNPGLTCASELCVDLGTGGAGGAAAGGPAGDSTGGGADQCDFAACAGDPIGSWQGEWICPQNGFTSGIGGVDSEPECEDAVILTDVTFDLALQLDPYHQFTYNGTILVYWQMTWTADCLGALNGQHYEPDQLAQLCTDYSNALTNDPASTFQSGKCAMDTAGVCRCDATQVGVISEQGGFSVSGEQIFFDSGHTLEFCRKGQTLEIRDEQTGFGPMVERLREAM